MRTLLIIAYALLMVLIGSLIFPVRNDIQVNNQRQQSHNEPIVHERQKNVAADM